MLHRSSVNMLQGSILKGLLQISIPIMIMNVAMNLFNIADMTVLRIFAAEDTFAVGAVGVCGPLITLITGLLIGCSAGANIVIAKYIGMGQREKVERATGTAVLFALVGGVALSVIGVCFAEVFLRWMKCSEALLSDAALYFRIYFAGLPLLMVYNFAAAILRSNGDSRRPMIFLLLGGSVNVAFNVLFVAGLGMTVAGVALGTVLSWVLMIVLALRALFKNEGATRLKLSRLRFYGPELKEILRLGIPAGLQQALYSIANVIISTAVNSFGPAATTGISIANNFDGILYQIIVAPSLAVMPYVSQNIGSGNIPRAHRSVLGGILITVSFGATVGALSAIFSGPLSSIMSSDPTVIAYSQEKMVIISSTYFICGINHILTEALRGSGHPNIPTVATLIYMCLLRFVWVYAFFPPRAELHLPLPRLAGRLDPLDRNPSSLLFHHLPQAPQGKSPLSPKGAYRVTPAARHKKKSKKPRDSRVVQKRFTDEEKN